MKIVKLNLEKEKKNGAENVYLLVADFVSSNSRIFSLYSSNFPMLGILLYITMI